MAHPEGWQSLAAKCAGEAQWQTEEGQVRVHREHVLEHQLRAPISHYRIMSCGESLREISVFKVTVVFVAPLPGFGGFGGAVAGGIGTRNLRLHQCSPAGTKTSKTCCSWLSR